MTAPAAWPWPHFSFAEMACHGEGCCGGAYACQPELMDALEALRAAVGVPLSVTSGYRCPKHNAAIGGHPNSAHLQGLAADISADGRLQYQILRHAAAVGFTGIGVASWGVHLDLLPDDPPRPNVWTYP